MSKRIDAHAHLFSFSETAGCVLIGWISRAFDVLYEEEEKVKEEIDRKVFVRERDFLDEKIKEPFFIVIARFINALITLTKTPECIFKTLRNLYAKKLKEDSEPLEDDEIVKVIVANMMDVEYGWNVKIERDSAVIERFSDVNSDFKEKRNELIKKMEKIIEKTKDKEEKEKYENLMNAFNRETKKILLKEETRVNILKNKERLKEFSVKNEIIEKLEGLNSLLIEANVNNIKDKIKEAYNIIEEIDKLIEETKRGDRESSAYITVICYEGIYKELKQKIEKIKRISDEKNHENDLIDLLKTYSINFNKYVEMIKDNQNDINNLYLYDKDKRQVYKDSVEKQIESLTNLKKEFKDEIYCFFSVDPRRTDLSGEKFNIIDFIKKEIINNNINRRTFLGIKIYPCLGYLPSHPRLMKIYGILSKIINSDHVPITAHCGIGSFPSIENELNFNGYISHNVLDKYHLLDLFNQSKFREHDKYGKYYCVDQNIERKKIKKAVNANPVYDCDGKKLLPMGVISAIYAHPLNWIPVLDGWNNLNQNEDNNDNRNLFIDLVHFGGAKELKEYLGLGNKIQDYNWTEIIISIMRDYKNVYTDLSANWNIDTIDRLKEKIIHNDKFKDIRNKMMFGSDFFCFTYFMFNPAYNYRYFMNLDYDDMFTKNPKKFLFG